MYNAAQNRSIIPFMKPCFPRTKIVIPANTSLTVAVWVYGSDSGKILLEKIIVKNGFMCQI